MLEEITAERLRKATAKLFFDAGEACLREFTLKSGHRVDLICLSRAQQITIIEIKSSRQDFISDRKWHNYLEWADHFYFAVSAHFPVELLPEASQCGIIISDGFDGHILRPAPQTPLAPARRAHLIRRLAFQAMNRTEI